MRVLNEFSGLEINFPWVQFFVGDTFVAVIHRGLGSVGEFSRGSFSTGNFFGDDIPGENFLFYVFRMRR